ncbi:unnamed protein product [Darwinula stevensoni]|uniref:Carboxylic ester hydrolase n=1 Tax=Darwinula stevensoni TaxID=69355 RepID=A0A7R9A8U0_9CRUS|nr:unnamed protein product [Darwinula stevensoni]CAG0896714.1 unnamed protein product [Darwinula stevensoni]
MASYCLYLAFIFAGLFSSGHSQEDTIEAETPLGKLLGRVNASIGGRNYYSFTGVPFAIAPLEELRFQPPVPVEPWQGVYDATQMPAKCIQPLLLGADATEPLILGVEDCLILNIYSPKEPNTGANDLPVLVWIHGGGYTMGGSEPLIYSPGYIMDRDVVLVTINYRLGALGFLSTEDPVAPGNYGMLDQVLALQFVRDNIAPFGGNPDKVTIFGESAGSESVHLLMLSPRAQGLFRYAISQSGTAIAPWTINEKSKEEAETLAQMAGCPTDSSENMLSCLRTVDAEILVLSSFGSWELGSSSLAFAPRVDVEAGAPFLPANPLDILQSGDYTAIPWMTGVNREEGLLLVYPALRKKELFTEIDQKWNEVYCPLFLYLEGPEVKNVRVTCEAIRSKYFKELPINMDSISDLIRVMSDRLFFLSTLKSAQLHSRRAPTYVYKLEYEGKIGLMDIQLAEDLADGMLKPHGVCHFDEIPFLFDIQLFPPIQDGSNDAVVRNRFLDLWMNFTYNGSPTQNPLENEPHWFPYTEADDRHYVIDVYPRLARDLVNSDVIEFWESLLTQDALIK